MMKSPSGVGADDDGPADQVVDDDVARGHLEAHGRRLAGGEPAPHLVRRGSARQRRS